MAKKRESMKNIRMLCPHHAIAERAATQAALTEGKLKLAVGDYVKRAFHQGGRTEHMWIKICKINRLTLSGNLDNDPVLVTNVACGDTIKFKLEEIENYLPGKGA